MKTSGEGACHLERLFKTQRLSKQNIRTQSPSEATDSDPDGGI